MSARLAASAGMAALAVAGVVLAITVSVWFFVAVPFLAGASYAAWLGMSARRFVDAIDGDDTGAQPLPF